MGTIRFLPLPWRHVCFYRQGSTGRRTPAGIRSSTFASGHGRRWGSPASMAARGLGLLELRQPAGSGRARREEGWTGLSSGPSTPSTRRLGASLSTRLTAENFQYPFRAKANLCSSLSLCPVCCTYAPKPHFHPVSPLRQAVHTVFPLTTTKAATNGDMFIIDALRTVVGGYNHKALRSALNQRAEHGSLSVFASNC